MILKSSLGKRLLIALPLVLVCASCGAGPNFEGQFFKIRLVNDLPHKVTVKYCTDSRCGTDSYGAKYEIASSQSVTLDVSDQRVRTTWRLFVDGVPIGCVSREFSAKVAHYEIRASSRAPCSKVP
jgi:hypothetical protein